MSTYSDRLYQVLKNMKMDAEQQLSALRAQQFAVFEILSNGDSLDRTAEQVTTLQRSIEQLDEALNLAKAVREGRTTGDHFPGARG
jgi:hypothetical protein